MGILNHVMLKYDVLKVEIVYAGGTISSLATSGGYREGGHKVDLLKLLEDRLPGVTKDVEISGTDFAYLGLSENIDFHYWKEIEKKVKEALARNPKTIIVTHGTDSMEHTAKYLQNKFKKALTRKRVVIILTGANQDISHPKTDAWDNLKFSLQCVSKRLSPDVYVAFHNRIIPANEVVKEPYNGEEMNYLSKKDKKYRDLKQIQKVRETRLIKEIKKEILNTVSHESVVEYPVNKVLKNHHKLLSKISGETKFVLLVLYHSGTANTENSITSIVKLINELRKEDIIFFGVTENGEPVDLHLYETSVKLRRAGLIPLYDMNRKVALAKLRLLSDRPRVEVINSMLKNYVGEIKLPIIKEDIEELVESYS